MDRALVKNWASAIEAFGNFVSPLTDSDMRPLPLTLDLPSGAWTIARLSYRVAFWSLTVRARLGPVW